MKMPVPQDCARNVALVALARADALDRRLLRAESLDEGERKIGRVEGRPRQRLDGFFDLDGVHAGDASLAVSWSQVAISFP